MTQITMSDAEARAKLSRCYDILLQAAARRQRRMEQNRTDSMGNPGGETILSASDGACPERTSIAKE